MSRIAVVLFNLGGPDGPGDVRPFLRNLFSDPAIIDSPTLVRLALSELISRTREKSAKANYAVMGGGSPLLAETRAQAKALEACLGERRAEDEVRVFIAMRYWTPLTGETARAVEAFAPDEVVLLPLYPQYSTTTTASSFAAWDKTYRGPGRRRAVCCYFDDELLIDAHAAMIERAFAAAGRPENIRLLFSAHGLPEKISDAGDPYRWQVEQTCARVAARLEGNWDWKVCYQSRVGPMKWIGPYTPAAIAEAGQEGLGVLVDPIAFVSEHIETLVELDRDYAELAEAAGVAPYLRVPALGTEALFVEALGGLVERALGRDGVQPSGGRCPSDQGRCALRSTLGEARA